MLSAALALSLSTSGLILPTGAAQQRQQQVQLSRRSVFSHAATFAATTAALAASPLAALADTEAELDAPMAGFDAAAEKRKVFLEKQKKFKKAWRKELSNLEFASNDAEFIEAVQNLARLIIANGREIPEGVRKMDLDQVYKTVKPRLQKEARMEFAKLDKMVLEIVTVKSMAENYSIE